MIDVPGDSRAPTVTAVEKLTGSRQHPCGDAEAGFYGPGCSADQRNSPLARRQGAGGASSTGAVVEETVVLPRLHLLRNSLRAAHRLRDEL